MGRLRRTGAALAALTLSLAAACGGADDAPPPDVEPPPRSQVGRGMPVVVDTDLAVDDLVALAFLLSADSVDVLAVTVSGTGEVRCPQGLAVVRSVLATTSHDDVPVACGRDTPLEGTRAFPTGWRDAADAGWGLELDPLAGSDTTRSASELLADSLGTGGVTVLALGPMTNLAEAFRADDDLAGRVASVVMMGGAVDVAGNVPAQPGAEWNVYVDPTAAREVLASGAPVVMVGLDATDRLPVTGEFLELLGTNAHTDAAALVDQLVRNNPQLYSGDAYFWEPPAAAVVVDPATVATERVSIEVVTDGPDSGRTVRSTDGTPLALAVRPRAARFEELLVRTLDQVAPGDPLARPPDVVGRLAITYDGGVCGYDGPARVPAGRTRVVFTTDDPAWTGAVVSLTGERPIRAILDWLADHPDNSRPVTGIRQATPVAAGFAMFVDLAPPRAAVICAAPADSELVLGGSLAVG